MKTKLILSAVVAASIALSSSVFATPSAGSNAPSAGLTPGQTILLYKKFCGEDGKAKDAFSMFLKKNVVESAGIDGPAEKKIMSRDFGDKLCKAIKLEALQAIKGNRSGRGSR